MSPPTVQPRLAVVQVKPPGDDVAVYEVIGAPPFEAGAAHARSTVPPLEPRLAELSVGAPGTVTAATGVAESALEAAPVPTPFVALTVKEYVVPFVSPLTLQPRPEVVHVKPPGEEVAVYEVTGEPFGAAADQESVTLLLPAVAEFSVGAPGRPAGVADKAFEAGPFPLAFVAMTVNE